MGFDIYIKQSILNRAAAGSAPIKNPINVNSLDMAGNLIKIGKYYVPIQHIIYIKEVI